MIVTTDTPLNVPFKEKDEAKSHGARWNPAAKHWYIPEGVDDAPFEKWRDGAAPAISAPSKQTEDTLPEHADLDDINAMLRDAVEDSDAEPPL